MNVIQENPQTLAESGCRGGRSSTLGTAHASLVIENLNEFGAGSAAGNCFCIADFIIRETQPAAA